MLERIVRGPSSRMFLAVIAIGAGVVLATTAAHAGPADSKTELPVDRGVDAARRRLHAEGRRIRPPGLAL